MEATVLLGHASGATVVLLELHPAMVDGASSIELIEVLHSADSAGRPSSRDEPGRARPAPGAVDLLRDGLADQLSAALDRARGAVDLLRPGGPRRLLGRLARWRGRWSTPAR